MIAELRRSRTRPVRWRAAAGGRRAAPAGRPPRRLRSRRVAAAPAGSAPSPAPSTGAAKPRARACTCVFIVPRVCPGAVAAVPAAVVLAAAAPAPADSGGQAVAHARYRVAALTTAAVGLVAAGVGGAALVVGQQRLPATARKGWLSSRRRAARGRHRRRGAVLGRIGAGGGWRHRVRAPARPAGWRAGVARSRGCRSGSGPVVSRRFLMRSPSPRVAWRLLPVSGSGGRRLPPRLGQGDHSPG